MTDGDRLAEKLAYLSEQTEALAGIASREPATMDAWVLRGVRYAVQTAAEALIDACYHVSAKRLHRAPANAHDAVDAVVRAGLLPVEHAQAWHRLIGLRNRLVHGYETISDERLLDAVRTGLDDLRAFLDAASGLV